MGEDSARIELGNPRRPDLEGIFGKICYGVRERGGPSPGPEAPSYGVQLIEEIERQKQAGLLDAEAYEYCLTAGGEILSLETVFFENQFVVM